MTFKIFVGYRTRPADNAAELMPTFTAAPNLTESKKIEADVAAQKMAFLRDVPTMPYTGTFDEIFIIDPKNEKRVQYNYSTAKDKSPVALRVRNYLLRNYPTAWTDNVQDLKRMKVVFVGFAPRLFLTMLGMECSLPHIGKPLPPDMWNASAGYCDIAEAILPIEYSRLSLRAVLQRRRPLDEKSASVWDKLLKDWQSPGITPLADAQLAFELAAQLNLITPA